MIYCGTNGSVFALDETTGNEVWRHRLPSGFMGNMHGVVAVMKKDRIVIAGCGGHVWGFDAVTGRELWHNGLPGLGHEPVSIAADGVSTQYVTQVETQER